MFQSTEMDCLEFDYSMEFTKFHHHQENMKRKRCVCCLTTEGACTVVFYCVHVDFLQNILKDKIEKYMICANCHVFAKKVYDFQQQVKENVQILEKQVELVEQRREKYKNKLIVKKLQNHDFLDEVDIQNTDILNKGIDTPNKAVDIPNKGIDTANVDILSKSLDIPEGIDTHYKSIGIPNKGIDTPNKSLDIPKIGIATPNKSVDIPNKGIGSPQQRGVPISCTVKTSNNGVINKKEQKQGVTVIPAANINAFNSFLLTNRNLVTDQPQQWAICTNSIPGRNLLTVTSLSAYPANQRSLINIAPAPISSCGSPKAPSTSIQSRIYPTISANVDQVNRPGSAFSSANNLNTNMTQSVNNPDSSAKQFTSISEVQNHIMTKLQHLKHTRAGYKNRGMVLKRNEDGKITLVEVPMEQIGSVSERTPLEEELKKKQQTTNNLTSIRQGQSSSSANSTIDKMAYFEVKHDNQPTTASANIKQELTDFDEMVPMVEINIDGIVKTEASNDIRPQEITEGAESEECPSVEQARMGGEGDSVPTVGRNPLQTVQSMINKMVPQQIRSNNATSAESGSSVPPPSWYKADVYDYIKDQELTVEEILAEREKKRKSESYSRKLYKCDDCIVGFSEEEKLKEHMHTYHLDALNVTGGATIYVCVFCKTIFFDLVKYRIHDNRHRKRLVCKLCGWASTSNKDIRDHVVGAHGAELQRHIDIPLYKCDKCEFTTKLQRRFYHHKTKHVGKYLCTHCYKRWNTAPALKEHTQVAHPEVKFDPGPKEKRHRCEVCGKSYGSRRALMMHQKSRHPKSDDESDIPLGGYCRECNKFYSSTPAYSNHMWAKHGVERRKGPTRKMPQFRCDDCGETFGVKKLIERHIKTVHLNMLIKCPICDKIFQQEKSKVRHMKVAHENYKPVRDKVCDICGKGFTTNNLLASHMNIHSEERPFKCKHCAADFKQKAALYNHNKLVHRPGGNSNSRFWKKKKQDTEEEQKEE